jgi:hypothetical protein
MYKDIKSENLIIIFYKLFTVNKFDLHIYICFLKTVLQLSTSFCPESLKGTC